MRALLVQQWITDCVAFDCRVRPLGLRYLSARFCRVGIVMQLRDGLKRSAFGGTGGVADRYRRWWGRVALVCVLAVTAAPVYGDCSDCPRHRDSTRTTQPLLDWSAEYRPIGWLKSVSHESLEEGLARHPAYSAVSPGWPGLYAGVSFRGLHPAATRYAYGGVPLTSAALGGWDLNDLPLESVAGAAFQRPFSRALTGMATIDLATIAFLNPEPFTRIVFREGALDRSRVEVLFRRPIGSQTYFAVNVNLRELDGNQGQGGIGDHENLKGKNVWLAVQRAFSRNVSVRATVLYHKRDVNTVARSTENFIGGHFARRDSARWHERRIVVDIAFQRQRPGAQPDFESHLTLTDFIGKFRAPLRQPGETSVPLEEKSLAWTVRLQRHTAYGTFYHEARLEHFRHRLDHFADDRFVRVETFRPGSMTAGRFTAGYDHVSADSLWHLYGVGGLIGQGAFGMLPVGTIGGERRLSSRSWVSWRGYLEGRFPTLYERLYRTANPPGIPGLPGFHAEQYAGVSVGFRLGKAPGFDLQPRVFWHQVIDPITGSPELTYRNAANRGIWGVEWEGRWRPAPLWLVEGTAQVQTLRRTASGFAPRESASIALTFVDPIERFYHSSLRSLIRLDLRYVGVRYARFYVPAARITGVTGRRLPGVLVTDLKAVTIVNTVSIVYELTNMFNRDYHTVAGYPMPLRTVRLGVEWSFLQ